VTTILNEFDAIRLLLRYDSCSNSAFPLSDMIQISKLLRGLKFGISGGRRDMG